MNHIQNVFKFLIVILVFIVMIRIYIRVAACVGEQFGIGKLFINLWEKIRRTKIE